MIELETHIVQNSELYLDVDCEASYKGDARIWKRRAWLDKEEGTIVTSDDVLFSANGNNGFEAATVVPPDIRDALKDRVNRAVAEILVPRCVSQPDTSMSSSGAEPGSAPEQLAEPLNNLKEIGTLLKTQDNRMTENPMFCVQVCERVGPLIEEYSMDGLMIHDSEQCATYYDDGPRKTKFRRLIALHTGGRLSGRYTVAGYANVWKTVAVCFTEQGCKDHLELNGHNYRHFHGVRIYTECFFRNPEMIAIREFLITQGEQTKTLQQHFELLEEPYRSKALAHLANHGNMSQKQTPSAYAALTVAFVWEDTPEGFDYWHKLYLKYLKLDETTCSL